MPATSATNLQNWRAHGGTGTKRQLAMAAATHHHWRSKGRCGEEPIERQQVCNLEWLPPLNHHLEPHPDVANLRSIFERRQPESLKKKCFLSLQKKNQN